MKIALAASLLCLSPAAVAGFAPLTTPRSASTQLRMSAPSTEATSDAISAAVAASRKYGAASPEARLAWEAVEEINASDNRSVRASAADDENDPPPCLDGRVPRFSSGKQPS